MDETPRNALEGVALKIPVLRKAVKAPEGTLHRSRPLMGILVLAVLVAVSLPLINITIIFPAYTEMLVGTIETGAVRIATHAIPVSARHTKLTPQSAHSLRLLADIYRLEQDFELLELDLYSPDGTTLYSSDATEIGIINKSPHFLREVSKGVPYSRLFSTTRPGPGGSARAVEVVETTIPLMQGKEFLGAFRFQFDITKVKTHMNRFNTYATYGVVFTSLFVLLVVIVLLNKESGRLEALRQAEKLMQDVNQITQHDIKSPLASTLSGINYLKQYTETNAEQREVLDEMHLAVMTGLELINRSLDIYKMETGRYEYQPSQVDLTALCRRVAADISGQAAAKNVTIKVGRVDIAVGESDSLTVMAEEPLCYALFANLMKNAVEASEAGHKVTVTLWSDGKGFATVHNSGVVPESIRETFFEKFVTADKKGGTGIGTYSAQLMAKTMQGTISMASSEQDGTTITVVLPLPGADDAG